ncbi:DsrE family protein [Thermoplasma acidophilum]|uniref:DsrE family protein n=1 Tax=Thermoplasma acidophilum TaxID=2303 RepID=UPI00001660EB|nr:DsrE family protein [Thermoplasma acidophilum]
MAKMLVMVITGKENINTEMVAFNFAINSVQNAKAQVELLFLGRGVEALFKNQNNSDTFLAQVQKARSLGIRLTVCSVSMKSLGVTDEMIFEGIEKVMGGVETAARIDDGYQVITF